MKYFLSFLTLIMSSEDLKQKIQDFEELIKQWNDLEAKMLKEIDEYNAGSNKLIYTEVWKPIDGYDNYIVSSYGNVYNIKRDKYVRQAFNKRYFFVRLFSNGVGKNYPVHRLVGKAFLLNPENKSSIDHVSGDRRNNNLTNLRWASHLENMQNRKIHKNNTSDFKGVSLCKCTNRYRARVRCGGKYLHIGRYDTKEEASEAYEAKAKEVFGEFYRPPSP